MVIRSQQNVPKKNQKIRWASGGQHAKGQPPSTTSTHWPQLYPIMPQRRPPDNPANRGGATCTEFGNGGAVGRFMCYLDHLQATAPTDHLPTYKRQPY